MNLGLPIARLLAAMVLAIIAWAAPSSADAHDGRGHEGYSHSGHYRAVLVPAGASTLSVIPADTAALMRSPAVAASASVETASAFRSDESDRGDGSGQHGLCLCGAACCAPGILAGSVVLSGPMPRNAVFRACNAPARAGIGPEALSEPPRTFA